MPIKGGEESIPLLTLQEHINDFAILIVRVPQILLLTLDLHEHLVVEKRIAVASVGAP